MKKSKGSSLIDYVIPTAVIGLVAGVAIYNAVTNNSLLNFISGSGNYNINAKGDALIIGKPTNTQTPVSELQGGGLGGTPGKPVLKCVNGECTIDYGEFILKGIPEDITDQSSSSSGGTDAIAALIEQIAEYLEAEGDSAGAAQYRDLANLGHYIASIEKESETLATSLTGADGKVNYGQFNLISNQTNATVPANVQALLSGIGSSTSQQDLYLGMKLDEARHEKVANPSGFTADMDKNVCYKFVDVYDQIMANSAYSGNLKTITQELYLQMADLTESYEKNVMSVMRYNVNIQQGNENNTYTNYDPLTGQGIGSDTLIDIDSESFLHPQSSSLTHLDSALICVAGKDLDSGKACHTP